MILPQTNATLLAVKRGGASEDYDAEEGEGNAVWTGEADAYFTRRRATFIEAQSRNVSTVQYVIVPGDLATFKVGDVLTVQKRGATVKVKVRAFPESFEDGPVAEPIKIELEDE